MDTKYNKKKSLNGWLVLIAIIIVLLGTFVSAFFFKSDEKIKIALKNGKIVSFLLIGVNNKKEITGSFVLFYNSKTKKIGSVLIPPKTYISFGKQMGYFTIEAAFKKGATLKEVKQGISNLLLHDSKVALKNTPLLLDGKINYFFTFNKKNVVKLIDLINGVNIFTKEDIRFPEKNIFFREGLKLFDGDRVTSYLSFEKDDKIKNEYNRLYRMINFIVGFIKLKDNFLDIFKNKFLKNYFFKTINKTDMKIEEFMILFNDIKKNYKDINKFDYSIGFDSRIVYCDVKKAAGYDYIYQPKNSGRFIKKEVIDMLTNISKENKSLINTGKVVIEIQNGTTVNGLARRARRYISSFGYDILKIGNANSDDYEKTVVIWYSSEKKGQKIADLIHCKNLLKDNSDDVIKNSNFSNLDVRIILGRDYDGRIVK